MSGQPSMPPADKSGLDQWQVSMAEERKWQAIDRLAARRFEALKLAHESGEDHKATVERARAYWEFMIEKTGE